MMPPPAGLREVFRYFLGDLRDGICPNTQELLQSDPIAGQTLVQAANALFLPPTEGVRTSLLELMKRSHREMATGGSSSRGWRRMYTDSCILLAYVDVLNFWSCGDSAHALSAISFLDHAIVIAGAPGAGRLELILDCIQHIQSECLPFPKELSAVDVPVKLPSPVSFSEFFVPGATNPVPRLKRPPSLSSFVSNLYRHPFILPGFLLDWPALNQHPWCSLEYLRMVAGPGRIVPVEVGQDYRNDDWTQKMMSWDDFLRNLDRQGSPGNQPQPVLYLAQHNLLNQFPALKEDIVVPDYVYADLDPPETYPRYVPPANEERLVLNAWLGPPGAVSPAHTDPFFNFYAQVVGRKTVWLAPPEVTTHMHAYRPGTASSSCSADQPRNPAVNNEAPSMSNTSQVDVFSTTKSDFPDFWNHVVPSAMFVTLEPGDLLFFPPGWWHAMRSEEISFSVSMWF